MRFRVLLAAGLAGCILEGLIFLSFFAGMVSAECVSYPPNPPHEPSGVKGCVLYGEGTASTWGGPGVARNDCVYPWTDCTPIRITSLDTGLSIEVTPIMYCDCYMRPGPNGEQTRIVDLGPSEVAALGLPGPGLWPVRVEPIEVVVLDSAPTPELEKSSSSDAVLPDTRMAP